MYGPVAVLYNERIHANIQDPDGNPMLFFLESHCLCCAYGCINRNTVQSDK